MYDFPDRLDYIPSLTSAFPKPPKRSDLIHVTFHFYRSAILLSLPSTSWVQILPLARSSVPLLCIKSKIQSPPLLIPPRWSFGTLGRTWPFSNRKLTVFDPGFNENRTVESLKTSLLPALVPLHNLLPSPPSSPDDIQLYEEKPLIEGEEEREAILLTRLDDGVDDRKTTIGSLGWRWKKVFVRWVLES